MYTKYTYLTNHYWNEIKIMKYLKQIPSYNDSFFLFQHYELNDSQLKLIFLKHPSTLQPLFSFVFQQKNYYFHLIHSFLKIVEKLQLLNKYHICYMNPYLLSYLIDNTQDIYLSQFSYSLIVKKIKKTGEIFLKKIPLFKNMCKEYPLELHFIYFLLFRSWDTLDPEKIQYVFSFYSVSENDDLYTFYSSFINQPKMKIVYSLFEYHSTWDLFILSKLYLPILSCCPMNSLNKEMISFLELNTSNLPTHRRKIHLENLVLSHKECLTSSS